MPTIKTIVQAYLEDKGMDAQELAERSGINLVTINGLLADGSLPRKAEHRENLRLVIGINKKAWAAALMESCNLPLIDDENAPLQVLIAHHMFQQGLTERSLALLSGVPYGTVFGMVRKGSIPRGGSLHKIGDALGLEPRIVAAAMQRSGGNPNLLPATKAEESAVEDGLAPLVAKRIRTLGLTIGSYSEQLNVSYFQLSRFLHSGTPPKDASLLKALRQDLQLDEFTFSSAVETATHQPKPGTVSARRGEPPPDANPLQQVLIRYINTRKITIKALAKELDLSQITVSRLVKQGVRPSRGRTHAQLRKLLNLDEETYGDLLAGRIQDPGSEALTPRPSSAASASSPRYPETEALIPKHRDIEVEFEASSSDDLSDTEILRLIRSLSPSQRRKTVAKLRKLKA